MEKLLVIAGPTAIGKTSLSIQLAQQLNGEIISGDSVQVYRGMDTGSAKVSEAEMMGIPHHLIDVVEPTDTYTAAHFKSDAERLINIINKRNKLPILVGGTGLYINGLLYDYHFSEAGKDDSFRANIARDIKENGLEASYKKLMALDPDAAKIISCNDEKRIIRALEVIETTGERYSNKHNLCKRYAFKRFDMMFYALTMNRSLLYERINLRVDQMMELGLIAEIDNLLKKGVDPHSSPMQAIGYKELIAYLNNECTIEEAVAQIKLHTRRFAKRQLTWFRRDPNITWIDLDEMNLKQACDKIYIDVNNHWKRTDDHSHEA